METDLWNKFKNSIWDVQKELNCSDLNTYPGKFYSEIPKRLIQLYTSKGETVLDCFCGSGTTNVEAKKLGRNSIGIDISRDAVDIANSRVLKLSGTTEHDIRVGDCSNVLTEFDTDKVALIVTSPPYFNILDYSKDQTNQDLGNINDYQAFLAKLSGIIEECYRVLKKGRYCCIVVGNVTTGGFRPLHKDIIDIAEKKEFKFTGDIIMVNRCDEPPTPNIKYSFPPLYTQIHEYIVLLEK